MIYDLRNPYQSQQFLEQVTKAVENEWIVDLHRKHPNRTLKQNNYLHLIIDYFASEYGISTDEAKHDVFKKECNADIFYRETVNKKGKTIRRLRSTKELDTAEMTLAINRFRNLSVSKYEIYLPSPEDNDYLLYCEQVAEQNKEFLTIQTK